jgi:hypothetical protein
MRLWNKASSEDKKKMMEIAERRKIEHVMKSTPS